MAICFSSGSGRQARKPFALRAENTVVAGLAREYNGRLLPLVDISENVRKTTVEEWMEIDWAYLRKG